MGRAKDFIQSLTPREYRVGWVIRTTSQGVIEDNAAEHGIPQDSNFWEQIAHDCRRLEINCMTIMRKLMPMQEEGHGDDDLVGSCWITQRSEAWKLWKDIGDHEALYSYDGLPQLVDGGEAILWRGVSEVGQSVLDCDFRFLEPFPQVQEAKKGRAKQFIMAHSPQVGPYTLDHWLERWGDEEVEIRCYLQDNRLHSGREVDNPGEYWDSVWVKGRDIPRLLKNLWLDYIEAEDDHQAFQSVDLYVTELSSALDELDVLHTIRD